MIMLGSTGCEPVVVGSLPTTSWSGATLYGDRTRKSFSASCRKGQA